MVNICAVYGCNENSIKSGLAFYRFPATNKKSINVQKQKLLEKRRTEWYKALKRDDLKEHQLDSRRICAKHFIRGKPAELNDDTNPDWIPTLYLGYSKKMGHSIIRLDRYKRTERRMKNKLTNSSKMNASNKCDSVQRSSSQIEIVDFLKAPSSETSSANVTEVMNSEISLETNIVEADCESYEPPSNEPSSVSIDSSSNAQSRDVTVLSESINTSTSSSDVTISSLLLELQCRNEEIYRLREEVAYYKLDEPGFRNNDKKICFYTGIPDMPLFMLLLKKITPCLEGIHCKNLTNFQKLLLTFMKLRFNSTFIGLGYRFNIDYRTASRIFKKVIIILYETFKDLVHWPDRESICDVMPACFRGKFGDRVAVIIDCFEISSQRPHTLKARNQTFSHYKQKHTVKYLIGITPHGVISFISHGYGGRVSDKFITEDSGILNHLQPGDVILADRGFTISELVATKNASLEIPSFVRGDQLDPKDVESTREIANVRIHVERVIGVIRQKYQILKGPICITLLNLKHKDNSFFDLIVHVCCVMINLCDSIVSLH